MRTTYVAFFWAVRKMRAMSKRAAKRHPQGAVSFVGALIAAQWVSGAERNAMAKFGRWFSGGLECFHRPCSSIDAAFAASTAGPLLTWRTCGAILVALPAIQHTLDCHAAQLSSRLACNPIHLALLQTANAMTMGMPPTYAPPGREAPSDQRMGI